MKLKIDTKSTSFRACLILTCLVGATCFLLPPVALTTKPEPKSNHEPDPIALAKAQAQMTTALTEQVTAVTNLFTVILYREHTMALMHQVFSQMAGTNNISAYNQRAGNFLTKVDIRLAHVREVIESANLYQKDLTNTLAHIQEIQKTYNEVIPRLQQERNDLRTLWEDDEAQNQELVASLHQEEAALTNSPEPKQLKQP